MKPDGTYTVEEFFTIAQQQLQSWEIDELTEKLGGISSLFVLDEMPEEPDLDDFDSYEILQEAMGRYDLDDILDEYRDDDICQYLLNRGYTIQQKPRLEKED